MTYDFFLPGLVLDAIEIRMAVTWPLGLMNCAIIRSTP